MADETATAGTAPAPVTELWAVVQSGFISPTSEIHSFRDDTGATYPQILSVWADQKTAEKRKNRLASKLMKVSAMPGKNASKSTPILGVMKVAFSGTSNRKPMTDEQKKKMAARLSAARKKAGK